MPKNNLIISLILSIIICVAFIPTLLVTELYDKLPISPPLILILFPIVTVIGMFLTEIIAKKIKILLQIAKFGLVGVSNTAIDFGVLNLLILATNITSEIGIIPMNIIAFTCALMNSYHWNKTWVFGESKKSSLLVFTIITLIVMSVNTAIVYVLTSLSSPMFGLSQPLWVNTAKVFATIFSLFANFVCYKLIVFKK